MEYSGGNPISGSPVYLMFGSPDDVPGRKLLEPDPVGAFRIASWSITFGWLPFRFALSTGALLLQHAVHGGHSGSSRCSRYLSL